MERSWLIQRLQKPSSPNPYSFGGGYKNGGLTDNAADLLGSVFSFDYMGAAEFEFGALPKALKKIATLNGSLVKGSIDVKTKNNNTAPVYYLCALDHREDVESRIMKFGKDEWSREINTKECVGLQDAIDASKYSRSLGWLELDNGYFFFIDKDMWEKTCELFEA